MKLNFNCFKHIALTYIVVNYAACTKILLWTNFELLRVMFLDIIYVWSSLLEMPVYPILCCHVLLSGSILGKGIRKSIYDIDNIFFKTMPPIRLLLCGLITYLNYDTWMWYSNVHIVYILPLFYGMQYSENKVIRSYVLCLIQSDPEKTEKWYLKFLYVPIFLNYRVGHFYYERFDVWPNCLGQMVIRHRPFQILLLPPIIWLYCVMLPKSRLQDIEKEIAEGCKRYNSIW